MNKRLECTLINAVDEADAVRKRGRAERPEPALWHVSQPQYGHQQPPQQQYATASGAAQTRARTCNSGGGKARHAPAKKTKLFSQRRARAACPAYE